MRQLLFSLFIIGTMMACQQANNEKLKIKKAMHNYDLHIISMNVDSIASCYTENGDLGDIAHGRDSIRRFLSKFANFKVLSQRSISDSVSIDQDTAIQMGIYRQTVIVSPGDTVLVKGSFRARWQRQMKGELWLIRRIDTHPMR